MMPELKIDKKTAVTYRQWDAPNLRAILLLVHGLGAHTARWEFLADFFQKSDISSYALELKGFGQTQGERGHIDTFAAYFQDIRSLYDIIRQENPDKKIFLLGESMGALICFLFSALESNLFSGLICISPAFASRLKFDFRTYLNIGLALIFNPKKQFLVSITPLMCTRDIDYEKIIDADPLDKRVATAQLYWNIFNGQIKVKFLKNRITVPLLLLTAGEDTVVDSLATCKVFNSLTIKDKEIINYSGMRHALSIDLGKEKVFKDILVWLAKKV